MDAIVNDFVKNQSKKIILTTSIKAAILLEIIQIFPLLGIFSEGSVSVLAFTLALIPTYILIGVILYELIKYSYKKTYLYELLESYDDPTKVVNSILKELNDIKKEKIGKTIFTKNWIVSKKNRGIDWFVNYNHIDDISFNLDSQSINFIPVTHLYTMIIHIEGGELPFQIGNREMNTERAIELINNLSEKQIKQKKIT